MERCCHLRNIQDLVSDGKTPCERRFGKPFNGPVIPSGARVEQMDASELHARKLNAEEVLTPQRSGNFIFPVADGTVKIFGWKQRPRTSTLTLDRPE